MSSHRPGLRGLRSGIALSCVGLLTATGCVSKQQLVRVEQERQRLSSELAQSQAATAESRQESQQLSTQLQVAVGESEENSARALETDAELGQTRIALSAVRENVRRSEGELLAVRQELAAAAMAANETRQQLAEAQTRDVKTSADLRGATSELAKLGDAHRTLATQFQAKQAELQQALRASAAAAEAQQAEIAKVRQAAADLETSRAAAADRLAQAEQRIKELSAKGDALAADLAAVKEASAKQTAALANQLGAAFAATASARQEALASRAQLQTARENLVKAEQSRDDAAKKLAESEKAVATLKAKVDRQAKNTAPNASAQASKAAAVLDTAD